MEFLLILVTIILRLLMMVNSFNDGDFNSFDDGDFKTFEDDDFNSFDDDVAEL